MKKESVESFKNHSHGKDISEEFNRSPTYNMSKFKRKNQPMGHFIFDPLYWVCKKWADIWNVWCQSVFSSLFFLLRMTNSKLSMIWVTLAKAPSDASVTEDLWVCLVHQLILWNKNHEWSQTNGSKWKKCLFRLNAMNFNF